MASAGGYSIGFRFRDLQRHGIFVGGTGSGKSNLILKTIHSLLSPENQAKHPCSVIFIDPVGDAAMDLARSFPDLTKLVVIDPHHVSFALNPLELTGYRSDSERKAQSIKRVDELKLYLSDVMKTDPERASRLSWIFTGDMHFLYQKHDGPTFRDFYHLVGDELEMDKSEIKSLLIGSGLDDKTIEKTLDGITSLQAQAFPPLLNRLARFVLPEGSIVTRTFCTRNSTVDIDEWLKLGRLIIVRIPKTSDITEEFRELLAATLILNIYFAVERRAGRLEDEGKDTSGRTQCFLFIDEFQVVEKLETLENILSQARKWGLSLIVANQYTSQITNKSLLEAILNNAGIVAVGSVSGDDERLFARVLGEDFVDSLKNNTTGRFTVRIKPYEPGTTARTESWPTSMAPRPIRSQEEVVAYMRTEMEKKYGGAEEAHDLIYKNDLLKVRDELGRPLLTPLRWYLFHWFYENSGNEFLRTDRQLEEYFLKKHGYKTTEINNALNDLMASGWVLARTDFMKEIVKGRDKETGQVIWGEPTTQDEKERSRVVLYSLTREAIEQFFTIRVHSSRAGKALHLLVIRRKVQEYWKLGYFCTVDTGEFHPKRPDILAFKRDTSKLGLDRWDMDSAVPFEVEIYPGKHPDKVVGNYEKNVANLMKPVFLVTLPEDVDTIHSILEDKDPESYRVKYEDVGLSRDRIRELSEAPVERADEPEGSKEPEDPERVRKREAKEKEVYEYWRGHGKPILDEPYRQKLLDDPDWKDDPIWKAAEEKARKRQMQEPPLAAPGIPQGAVALETPPQPQEAREEMPKEPVLTRSPQLHKLSLAFMKRMVLVLNAVNRDIRTSEDLASAMGVSQRQVLRYLDELVSRGYVKDEKRKYFITEKGRTILTGPD